MFVDCRTYRQSSATKSAVNLQQNFLPSYQSPSTKYKSLTHISKIYPEYCQSESSIRKEGWFMSFPFERKWPGWVALEREQFFCAQVFSLFCAQKLFHSVRNNVEEESPLHKSRKTLGIGSPRIPKLAVACVTILISTCHRLILNCLLLFGKL